MYEIIKNNDFESFYKTFQEKPLIKFLGEIKNYLNYRTYYKINSDGTVKEKDFNLSLIKLILLKDFRNKENIKEFFENGILFSENQKLKKINRLSNLNIEDLDKNLYKIYHNRDLPYALKYTKEYFLKDKEKLKKKLVQYILLDRVESKKALVLIAMFELMNHIKDDEDLDTVLHIFLNYIVTYPSIFYWDKFQGELQDMDLYALAYKKNIDYLGTNHDFEIKLNSYRVHKNFSKIDELLYNYLGGNYELY